MTDDAYLAVEEMLAAEHERRHRPNDYCWKTRRWFIRGMPGRPVYAPRDFGVPSWQCVFWRSHEVIRWNSDLPQVKIRIGYHFHSEHYAQYHVEHRTVSLGDPDLDASVVDCFNLQSSTLMRLPWKAIKAYVGFNHRECIAIGCVAVVFFAALAAVF